MTIARFRTVAVIAAVSLLTSGCACDRLVKNPPTDWAGGIYTAVVRTLGTPDPTGDLARLNAYNKALKDVLNVTEFGERFIECLGCGELPGMPTGNELKFNFYREHLDHMHAFTTAMKRVQATPNGSVNFTVTYSASLVSLGSCTATCMSKSICTQYGRCDGIPSTNMCDPCP